MEEVFWSIVHDDNKGNDDNHNSDRPNPAKTAKSRKARESRRSSLKNTAFQIDEDSIRRMLEIEKPKLSPIHRLRVQIAAVMTKRYQISKRDLRGILTQIVMPVLSLLFGLSLMDSLDDAAAPSPDVLDFNADIYGIPLVVPVNGMDRHSIMDSRSEDIQFERMDDGVYGLSLREMNEWILEESYRGALFVDNSRDSVTLLFDPKNTHSLVYTLFFPV